jgi:hypothetical protein
VNDLTKPERIQLEELETVISNGIQTFAEVGNALYNSGGRSAGKPERVTL